jgi:hypothetical protein
MLISKPDKFVWAAEGAAKYVLRELKGEEKWPVNLQPRTCDEEMGVAEYFLDIGVTIKVWLIEHNNDQWEIDHVLVVADGSDYTFYPDPRGKLEQR